MRGLEHSKPVIKADSMLLETVSKALRLALATRKVPSTFDLHRSHSQRHIFSSYGLPKPRSKYPFMRTLRSQWAVSNPGRH